MPEPLDLKRLKVYPLAERRSLSAIEKILVDPDKAPASCQADVQSLIRGCAEKIRAARQRDAGVILMYGAHLVKNGAQRIVNALVSNGWITHLATNGAGTIHDWELAFLGRTEENVRDNVATGTFGTWDETGRYLQLALLAGALREEPLNPGQENQAASTSTNAGTTSPSPIGWERAGVRAGVQGEGYGCSLGRFITEDGVTLPTTMALEAALREQPAHPLSPARAELLQTMLVHKLSGGRIEVKHPWKDTSILTQAFQHNTPFTVHPGIGYDIIANHPMFNGAAIGRAAEMDFRVLGGSVERLDGGVVLSVGSAIMAPQVFEKSVSCVNNLRLQTGKKILHDHTMYVVDIQDSGNWDWSRGEPPKDNPAYYLRFCKSFSRMGGEMKYVQCDNVTFLHQVLAALPKN